MAGGPFKESYNNHKKSFNLKRHEKETALSRHIWALKQDGAVFSIRWKILAQSNTQKGASGLCNLCQAEKLAIINHNSPYLLNKRSEIISQCRHGKTRKKQVKRTKAEQRARLLADHLFHWPPDERTSVKLWVEVHWVFTPKLEYYKLFWFQNWALLPVPYWTYTCIYIYIYIYI